MASRTHSLARGKTGTTKPEDGLIVRAIKNDEKVDGDVEYLLQQFGEFYFGVERIEELGAEDRHGWIKFSTTVGKAHHNLSKLAEVIEGAIQSELDADLGLIQAEIEVLEKRQDEDAVRAQRNQDRKEAREDVAEERKDAAFAQYLADREQKRAVDLACHQQDLTERETRRKVYRAREGVLIGITIFCVLLSAFLIIFGVAHDKLIFIGGSGVSATIAIGGFAKLVFGRGDPPSSPTDEKAEPQ